jgi:hypothetical protein
MTTTVMHQRQAIAAVRTRRAMSSDSGHHPHATVEELTVGERAIVREHLDHMRSIADIVQREIPPTLRERLDALLSFLHHEVTSHIQREEEVFCPPFDRMSGPGWSSEAMRPNHEAIIGMLDELDRAIGETRHGWWPDDIERLLFVREAVIRLHGEREARLSASFAGRSAFRVEESLGQGIGGHAVPHDHALWRFSAHPEPE